MDGAFVLDPSAADRSEPFEWGGGTFHVRHVSPGRMRAIRKSIGLPEWAPAGETLSDRDRERLERAVLDWTLEDWSGVVDPQGEPVPCNSETRWAMVCSSEVFAEALTRWSPMVWLMRQRSARDELGNSRSSSPSGGDGTRTGSTATSGDAVGSETARSGD